MENRIVCGDALAVMAGMPESCVDLIVTSPPYNVGIRYDVCDDKQPVGHYHEWLRLTCRAMFRLIKPNCNVFINICDIGVSVGDAEGIHKVGNRGNFYVIPHHAVVIDEMLRAGAQYLHPILWKKPSNHTSQFGANARFCGTYPYPRNCHVPSEIEYILHFRKNGVWKKVPKEVKAASRLTRERWLTLSGQVWEFNGTADKAHPAQFPVELPARCIEGWSFVDDLVLDPFYGAGNTCVAAAKSRRRCIGIDLSPSYCEIAAERVRAAVI